MLHLPDELILQIIACACYLDYHYPIDRESFLPHNPHYTC